MRKFVKNVLVLTNVKRDASVIATLAVIANIKNEYSNKYELN